MPLLRPGRLATAIGASVLTVTVLRLRRRRARPSLSARRRDPRLEPAPLPCGIAEQPPGRRDAGETDSSHGSPQRFRPPGGFRADVEGLRGVAILLVLLFHSAVGPPGGFIGVDVFFVISGFLITGMLVREAERSGGIGLARFYARRFRRLLPAAVVVLVVTLPIAALVVAPLDRTAVMEDGAAAVLSISNIRFALDQGDYFAAVDGPSPFLHFWSLSVEEQFYLLWPLLLLLVTQHRRARAAAGVALGIVLVASLAASVVMTQDSGPMAFYALPSRAWQFAAGGLVAILAATIDRVPGPVMALGGWVGTAVLVVAAIALDGSMSYPGLLAMMPTVAAVLLIASGEHRGGPGKVLCLPPLRFLGRISYSLYLWHWPILVLPAIAIGAPLPPEIVAMLIAASVAVGWASWARIEQRFYQPGMARELAAGPRPRVWRTIATSGLTIALTVAVAGGLGLAAAGGVPPIDASSAGRVDASTGDLGPVAIAEPASVDVLASPLPATSPPAAGDESPARSADPGTAPEPVHFVPGGGQAPPDRLGPTEDPPSLPSPTPVPPSPSPSPAAGWTLTVPEADLTDDVRLPMDVAPSLGAARNDIERLFADGCITQTSGVRPTACVYGRRDGSPTIALVGDSHASHLFPAFNVLANRHGWRLLPYVKVSCPFVDMPVYNPLIKREYTECATWRTRVIAELNEIHPDLVVVASGYRAIIAARAADATPARQGAAMARAVAVLESPVAILIDSPRAEFDIPACLSRHRTDVHACAIPRAQAFPPQFGSREAMAARSTGAGLLDLVGSVCPTSPCPVVRDGMILYRDRHHLTATFARSLADPLDAALAPYLRPSPVEPAVGGPRT